jgi:pimeloyl-ACP methyl ester carboxylesterase
VLVFSTAATTNSKNTKSIYYKAAKLDDSTNFSMEFSEIRKIETPDGGSLSYCRSEGRTPGVMFLGGFMSDMKGSKATALEKHCRQKSQAFIRFDYRGHGDSTGNFEDGTIGSWTQDALLILDQATKGPQILIGSSMGGWLMILLALARPSRVSGLIGVAAAPDFTERLLWEKLPEEAILALEETGFWDQPSEYSEQPYRITKELIEEGRDHLILNGPIHLDVPVRLIHGINDADVPWYYAQAIQDRIRGSDVSAVLIKDGDHRLSREQDIARICSELDSLCAQIS